MSRCSGSTQRGTVECGAWLCQGGAASDDADHPGRLQPGHPLLSQLAVKAIGYVRVSSQEQRLGQTIRLQEKAIKERAVTEGWRLLRIERDDGASGSNGLDTRRGLADALAACEAGEAELLVVTEYSRLARDLVLQETTIQRLAAVGVRVVAIMEPEVGGDDHTRTLIRQVLGAVKQYERAVIRSRMEAGRTRAVAEGRRGQGAPPYGWRAAERDEKGRRGRLVANPQEQAVLAKMRALRADGASLRDVCRALDAEGITARRGQVAPGHRETGARQTGVGGLRL